MNASELSRTLETTKTAITPLGQHSTSSPLRWAKFAAGKLSLFPGCQFEQENVISTSVRTVLHHLTDHLPHQWEIAVDLGGD